MAGYNIQGAVNSLALGVGRTAGIVAGVRNQAKEKNAVDQKMLAQQVLQNETNTRLAKQQENLAELNKLQMLKDVSNDIKQTRADELELEQDNKYYDELFEGESDYDKLSVMASDNKYKMLNSRRRAIEAQKKFNEARETYINYGTLEPTASERHKVAQEKIKEFKRGVAEMRQAEEAEREANE